MNLTAKVIISVITCVGLGFISGWSTTGEISNWYTTIKKPSWNPPNWLFGPVWSVLYLLMGIAVALVWQSNHPYKKQALILFCVQFIFNLLWSLIFFNLHRIGLALVNILLMLLFITLTIYAFKKVNKWAMYLLIPYWLWVAFASCLNYSIYMLNK